MQKFGRGDGGNDRLYIGRLPEKTGHVEFAAFVRDQQRTVEH